MHFPVFQYLSLAGAKHQSLLARLQRLLRECPFAIVVLFICQPVIFQLYRLAGYVRHFHPAGAVSFAVNDGIGILRQNLCNLKRRIFRHFGNLGIFQIVFRIGHARRRVGNLLVLPFSVSAVGYIGNQRRDFQLLQRIAARRG